jgi:LysM repeat protein
MAALAGAVALVGRPAVVGGEDQRFIRSGASGHSRETVGGIMDYRVQSGDTLSGIAAKFNVSLAAVEAANPQIRDPNKIFPNELVHIPASRASAHGPAPVPPHVVTYAVQPGDTMSGIADAHGISLAALVAANPQVTNPDIIHPGEVLTKECVSRSTDSGYAVM